MKQVRIEIAGAILGVSRVAIIKARKLGRFPGSGSEPVDLDVVPMSDWGQRREVTRDDARCSDSYAKIGMNPMNSEAPNRSSGNPIAAKAGEDLKSPTSRSGR
jgi:hypothetical protein